MRHKVHKNSFLIVFCVIIVVGYLFFFSSKIFMDEKSAYITPIQTTLTGNNRQYTLQAWNYSPDNGTMEVMIAINNQAYDSINAYTFSLYDLKYGYIQGQKVVENRDLLVLRFYGIEKITSLSLRVAIDNSENTDIVQEIVKFYTNKDDVNKLDRIEDREAYEYYILKIEGQVEKYNQDIEAYQSVIKDLKVKIESAEKNIEDLEQNKSFKTENEIQVIDNQISNVTSDISNFEYEIHQNEELIRERKLQIENANEQIDTIKKANAEGSDA